jgi:hypothetical protein
MKTSVLCFTIVTLELQNEEPSSWCFLSLLTASGNCNCQSQWAYRTLLYTQQPTAFAFNRLEVGICPSNFLSSKALASFPTQYCEVDKRTRPVLLQCSVVCSVGYRLPIPTDTWRRETNPMFQARHRAPSSGKLQLGITDPHSKFRMSD